MRLILLVSLLLSSVTMASACERLCSKDFWTLATIEDVNTELAAQAHIDTQKDVYGNGVMHWAAAYGRSEHIEGLIEAGAEADTPNRFFGETPIFWALKSGNVEAFSSLVSAGVNVNVTDGSGVPLLHVSAAHGRYKEVMILLEAGADGRVRTGDGRVAFDVAKTNPWIRGTPAYWALNAAQFN